MGTSSKNRNKTKQERVANSINKFDGKEKLLFSFANDLFRRAQLQGFFTRNLLKEYFDGPSISDLIADDSDEQVKIRKKQEKEYEEFCDFIKNRIAELLVDNSTNTVLSKWKESDIEQIIIDFKQICEEKKVINTTDKFIKDVIGCKPLASSGEIILLHFLLQCFKTKKLETPQNSFQICVFDIMYSTVYIGLLLKDTVFFVKKNRNWKECQHFDLIILSNFRKRTEGEYLVPIMGMNYDTGEDEVIEEQTEVNYVYDIKGCTEEFQDAVNKINNKQHVFCYFPESLAKSQKNELKELQQNNHMSVKANIQFIDHYLEEDENGEIKQSNIDYVIGDLYILQKGNIQENRNSYVITKIDNKTESLQLNTLVQDIFNKNKDQSQIYVIPSSIDFTAGFNEIIRAKADNEILQEQFDNGFQFYSGSDLVCDVRYYKPDQDAGFINNSQAFYLPTEPIVFKLTGINDSITVLRNIVFNSNLKISDLRLNQIPWYHFIAKKYPQLNDLNVMSYPLNGAFNNLENGISVEKKYLGGDVIINFMDEYGNISLHEEIHNKGSVKQVNEIVIASCNDVIQTLKYDSDTYEDKFDLIKNQIIKANSVQIILDETKVLYPFFKYYLTHTDTGKKLMEVWKECAISNNVYNAPLEVFKSLKIILPDIKRQKELLQQINYIKETERMMEVNSKNLKDYIDGKTKFYKILTVGDNSSQNENNTLLGNSSVYEVLPQPLAAILYLDEYEDKECYCRKNKNIINFFEATAQFHATVLLSLLIMQDPSEDKVAEIVQDVLLKDAIGDGNRDKAYTYIKIRFPFGTWTTIITKIHRECPTLLHLDGKFCADFNTKLEEARDIRNKESGHTYGKTIEDDRELYEKLQILARELTNDLINIYNDIDILYVKGKRETEDGNNVLFGGKAKGVNNRLRYFEIPINKKQPKDDSNKKRHLYRFGLCIKKRNEEAIVPIIPLVRYGDMLRTDDMMKSMYFAKEIEIFFENNQRKDSFVHWQTYDFGEIRDKYDYYQPNNFTYQLIEWITNNLRSID